MASGSISFQRLTQDISNNIYKISNNVTQLQSLQKQLSGKSDAELKSKFHDLQHYTHQLATETGSKMKELTNYQGPDVDQRTQKFQKERLLNEFSKILSTFQNIQRQEKDLEEKAIGSRVSNPFDDDAVLGGFEQKGYQSQTMVQIDASEVDLEILRERDDALGKLESDISDVNQIFKDLSILVHEQGEVIETIEDNVVSAAVHVEQGTEELHKARKHQTSARKKKLIIFIIVLVIIIIIAIILGVELRK